MKSIVRWYIAGFYKKPKGLKKPYNPILGEVFRCYWQHPKTGSRTFYITEQVSSITIWKSFHSFKNISYKCIIVCRISVWKYICGVKVISFVMSLLKTSKLRLLSQLTSFQNRSSFGESFTRRSTYWNTIWTQALVTSKIVSPIYRFLIKEITSNRNLTKEIVNYVGFTKVWLNNN